MKIAIMQPYFLPYIGYFQLISAVDLFVVYDNIKYTKKGWINRNRLLRNCQDITFSLPLKNDSDYLNICDRELAQLYSREKLLNQFRGAYHNAPYFGSTFKLIEEILNNKEANLFLYLFNSISKVCNYLNLSTKIIASSSIDINHKLQAQDKVLAICEALGASVYINASGGRGLYNYESFQSKGIELSFIRSLSFEYSQNCSNFIPSLSIIDVLMFNPIFQAQEEVKTGYRILK